MRLTEGYIRNKENAHIRISKNFYIDKKYKILKSWDRELYAICRDRWSLSLKNNYTNEKGEIYFYANQEELAKYIGVSRKTIIEGFKKLIELRLLEKEVIKTKKGTANIYFICELEITDHVTESYTLCHPELQGSNHVTESYTSNTEYNVSIINRINLINNNKMESEKIAMVFYESNLSEKIIFKLLDFLEIRSRGEKVLVAEVNATVKELKKKYKTEEIQNEAIDFAIGSRHNGFFYGEEKKIGNKYNTGVNKEDMPKTKWN